MESRNLPPLIKIKQKKDDEKMSNNSFGLMSVKDFANELNKSTNTIRTWIRRNEIPADVYIKIAGTIFILPDKFKKWVDNGARRDIPGEDE